jgi:hypothetical protein
MPEYTYRHRFVQDPDPDTMDGQFSKQHFFIAFQKIAIKLFYNLHKKNLKYFA